MKRSVLFLCIFLIGMLIINCTSFAGREQDNANNIIANPPPATVISDSKTMYYKIKKVGSIVESGKISYNRYLPMVTDLKAEYDIFSSEQRDHAELVELLGVPVKHFLNAADYWGNSINGNPKAWTRQDDNDYKKLNQDFRDDSFKDAISSLEILDAMLYKLKQQKADR